MLGVFTAAAGSLLITTSPYEDKTYTLADLTEQDHLSIHQQCEDWPPSQKNYCLDLKETGWIEKQIFTQKFNKALNTTGKISLFLGSTLTLVGACRILTPTTSSDILKKYDATRLKLP